MNIYEMTVDVPNKFVYTHTCTEQVRLHTHVHPVQKGVSSNREIRKAKFLGWKSSGGVQHSDGSCLETE